MEIKGFIENSLLEWEGKISSVVFLPLCNLRCRYCHATHLVMHPGRLESIAPRRITDYLARQDGWVDGIVITGGEPTLHGEELVEFIHQVRGHSLEVMLETNGTQPDQLRRLIDDHLLEALAMDVKAPLTEQDYRRVAGVDVDVEAVRRSMDIIRNSGLPHEFRITLVPGLVGLDELRRMIPDLEGAGRVALQNFMPDHCLCPDLREVVPYTADELDAMAAEVRAAGIPCIVRGEDHAARVRSRA